MKKKILEFLFPNATIISIIIFFALIQFAPDTEIAAICALIFFFCFMIPLDIIICVVKAIKKLGSDKEKTQMDDSQTQAQAKPVVNNKSVNPVVNHKSDKDIEDYASLCVASCEFDKNQNITDPDTNANVRYNDKRFDNVDNDPKLRTIISEEKIKVVSEQISKLYSDIGADVLIDGVIYSKPYIILKLFPIHGTKIETILTFSNNIE